MHQQPTMEDRQTALARAGQLTGELIELVRELRAGVADVVERPARTAPPPSGRLKSGDLRAAIGGANRRSTRQVPHLLG